MTSSGPVTNPQPQQQLSHPGEKHSPGTTQHIPADPGRVGSRAGAVPQGVALETGKSTAGATWGQRTSTWLHQVLGVLSQLSSAGGEVPPAKGL